MAMSFVLSENDLVLWADERRSYVQNMKAIRLRFQDASNFGLHSHGQLFKTTWPALLNIRPNILEVDSDTTAVLALDKFVKRLTTHNEAGPVADPKPYLSNITCAKLYDSCDLVVDSLMSLLPYIPQLAAFDVLCASDENDQSIDRHNFLSRLLPCLKSKAKLKAISFNCPMTIDLMNDWIDALKLNVRLVTFNGNFQMDNFMKCRNEMPCVEFLALQSFDRRLRDDEYQDENTPAKIDEEKFFRKIENVFRNLAILFFDWNVVDTVCVYDARTSRIVLAIQSLYKRLKLQSTFQFVAILIYTPDRETKASALKIVDLLTKENDSEGVKVRHVEFSTDPDTPNNFTFIFFGDYHYQARTKRMVDLVTERRSTNPNLSHFCYVVDSDNYLHDDLSMSFADFDSVAVKSRYDTAKEKKRPFLSSEI